MQSVNEFLNVERVPAFESSCVSRIVKLGCQILWNPFTEATRAESAMEKGNPMIVESPKDLFEFLLSSTADGAERLAPALEELSRNIEDRNIEDALNAQVFVLRNIVGVLGQCFRLLRGQRSEIRARLLDVFMEEYRSELARVTSPTARRLLVLAKANALIQLSIGEFSTLIAIAEMTGDWGVGLLLDGCLVQNTAFVERTKRLIGTIVDGNGTATLSAAFDQPQRRIN